MMLKSRQLRRPRITGLKALVPKRVKAGPKALQGQLLTATASRLRRNVTTDGTVFVSSWPRSGSTWLFEMLATERALLPIFEPFHPAHNPFMQPYTDVLGFVAGPDDADVGPLRSLATEICTGRRMTRWSSNRAPRDRILKAPRTLVKEVRVGPALPWLTGSFPEMATIVLVRHPCAVIESIRRTPGEWQDWPDGDIRGTLASHFGEELAERLGGAERLVLLAALWAAHVDSSLAAARSSDSVSVVTYEDLVSRPDATLGRLGRFCGLADLSADPERLSLQTHGSSPLHQGVSDPLSMWSAKLDGSSVRRILEVTQLLGIDFYSEDPHPDRAKLARASTPSGTAA